MPQHRLGESEDTLVTRRMVTARVAMDNTSSTTPQLCDHGDELTGVLDSRHVYPSWWCCWMSRCTDAAVNPTNLIPMSMSSHSTTQGTTPMVVDSTSPSTPLAYFKSIFNDAKTADRVLVLAIRSYPSSITTTATATHTEAPDARRGTKRRRVETPLALDADLDSMGPQPMSDIPPAEDSKSSGSAVSASATTTPTTLFKRLHVHALVLASQSEFFRNMLHGKTTWKEAADSNVPIEVSVTDEAEGELHVDLIRFLYTGELEATSGSRLVDLMMLGDKWGVTALLSAALQRLQADMSVDLAVSLLDLTTKPIQMSDSCTALIQLAKDHLITRFASFSKQAQDELVRLPLQAVCHVLSSDKLMAPCENEVYLFARRWIRGDGVAAVGGGTAAVAVGVGGGNDDRKQQGVSCTELLQLLKTVRLLNLSTPFYLREVVDDPLFRDGGNTNANTNPTMVMFRHMHHATLFHLMGEVSQRDCITGQKSAKRRLGYRTIRNPSISIDWKVKIADIRRMDAKEGYQPASSSSPIVMLDGFSFQCHVYGDQKDCGNASFNPNAMVQPMAYMDLAKEDTKAKSADLRLECMCYCRPVDQSPFEKTSNKANSMHISKYRAGDMWNGAVCVFRDDAVSMDHLQRGEPARFVHSDGTLELSVRITIISKQPWWTPPE